jgi:hypothetical protein
MALATPLVACIIRNRPHDFNVRIGKSHGSNTLPRRAMNLHVNLLIAGSPQPASNAVLAVGFDF